MKKLFILIAIWSAFIATAAVASPILEVSELAKDWRIRYSPGMPFHPIQFDITGWEFDFPISDLSFLNTSDFSSVNYVTTKKFPKMVVGQTITMQFQVIASPDVVFEYGYGPRNPCEYPAHVRLFIQKGMQNGGGRWWAIDGAADLELAADGQIVTISVPLLPELWSGIWGEMGTDNLDDFNRTVTNASDIGMTFGGGCFAGHGVWINQGFATFKLLSYTVE